jgi:hypothetical protein
MLILLLLINFGALAHADQTVIIDAPSTTDEMLRNPKIDGETPVDSHICTDSSGEKIRSDEVGYSDCVRIQRQKRHAPRTPSPAENLILNSVGGSVKSEPSYPLKAPQGGGQTKPTPDLTIPND